MQALGMVLSGLWIVACQPAWIRPEASIPPSFHPLPDPSHMPSGAVATKVISMSMPVDLAFAPDGRMFITEKGGMKGDHEAHVYAFDGSQLQIYLTLTVSTDGERGLLGVALDPNFQRNHFSKRSPLIHLVYSISLEISNSGLTASYMSRLVTCV